MKTYVDSLTGQVHQLMDGETPNPSWVELIDNYKKYIDPNGDIHTILKDALPGLDWEPYEEPIGGPDPFYRPPYNALRANSYPTIENQLDMLWHELNNTGTISKTGAWFDSIKDVKDQFPKP